MSTINFNAVEDKVTTTRLESYLQATGDDVEAAIRLYDWNTSVSSALYEDLGRLEVIFRNAMDSALVKHGTSKAWPSVWYKRTQLFRGKNASRTRIDLETARDRATRRGKYPEVHGKVIAELSFGFWRYLTSSHYLTSLWLPALAAAFPLHPSSNEPHRVRPEVEYRAQRLLFLRNRIAHHEPIHRRNLLQDHDHLLKLAGWICADSQTWIAARSRTPGIVAARSRTPGIVAARP